MTQSEADLRDARRYRIMRLLMTSSEAVQDEAEALVADLVGDQAPTPQLVDRIMDHLLNTMKLV